MLRPILQKQARTFLVAACFALVLAIAAWGATESPSYRKCVANHGHDNGEQEREEFPSSGEIVSPLRLFLRCEGKFVDENSVLLTAIATGFIAWFTFSLRSATLRLWEAGERQLAQLTEQVNLARDEFISTHRPRIIVRQVAFTRQGFTAGERLQISFTCVNAGDSDAVLRDVRAKVVVAPVNIPYGTELVAVPRRQILKSGEHQPFVSPAGDILDHGLEQAIRMGGQKVFLFGYVQYEDERGLPRYTGFCRACDIHADRFVAVNDQEYEYSY